MCNWKNDMRDIAYLMLEVCLAYIFYYMTDSIVSINFENTSVVDYVSFESFSFLIPVAWWLQGYYWFKCIRGKVCVKCQVASDNETQNLV